MTHAGVIARDCAGIARVCGRGPFVATRGSVRAKLAGPQVISGIREIWVGDVYLKDRFLDVARGALVVDLGACIALGRAARLA
jgi:hypothetical protein